MLSFLSSLSFTLLLFSAANLVGINAQESDSKPNVLFYTYTPGFRHDSIPTALETFQSLADKYDAFNPIFTEDPEFWTPGNISNITATVWISTSEQVFTTDQQLQTFFDFLTRGGGFLGFHLAAGTLYLNEFYGNMVGSYFTYHPEFQNASFIVEDDTHRTTRSIPSNWTFAEEVYNFQSDPRNTNSTVLISVDANSYNDPNLSELQRQNETPAQGIPHPISWYRETPFDLTNHTNPETALNFTFTNADGVQSSASSSASGDDDDDDEESSADYSNVNTIMTGRMYYSGLGHANETWRDPTFMTYANDCLEWVLGIDSTPEVTESATGSATADGENPSESVDFSSALNKQNFINPGLIGLFTILVAFLLTIG